MSKNKSDRHFWQYSSPVLGQSELGQSKLGQGELGQSKLDQNALDQNALDQNALKLMGQGWALGMVMVFWGWVLEVYQMPTLGWIGTILCVLHLGWVGKSAIAPSSVWLLLIFWIAALNYAEPQFLTGSKGEIWALSLLMLWLMAMITLVAIVQTQNHCRWMTRPKRFFLLSTINLAGLWGGTQLIQFNPVQFLAEIAGF